MNAESAFAACVTHMPFHHILWMLYNVSSYLHSLKPTDQVLSEERRKVSLVAEDQKILTTSNEHSFIKTPDFVPNGFYIDNFLCFMRYEKSCYQIPIEWISRIFLRDGSWWLFEKRFCCRLNFTKRDDFALMLEQDFCLDGVDVHESLYHIGLGKCNDREKSKFIKSCGINFGWSKIFNFVKSSGVNEGIFFKMLQGLNDDDFFIINHIVLCERCCVYLEKLLSMLKIKYCDNRRPTRAGIVNAVEKRFLFFQSTVFKNYIVELSCSDVLTYLRDKSVFTVTIKDDEQ